MKNFLKKSIKKVTKETLNTTGAILGGALDGIDESINGDDIKEIRDRNREIRRVENLRLSKVRNFSWWVWSLAFLAIIVMVGQVIMTHEGNGQLIQTVIDAHGLLLLVPFLIATMLTMFSNKMIK